IPRKIPSAEPPRKESATHASAADDFIADMSAARVPRARANYLDARNEVKAVEHGRIEVSINAENRARVFRPVLPCGESVSLPRLGAQLIGTRRPHSNTSVTRPAQTPGLATPIMLAEPPRTAA